MKKSWPDVNFPAHLMLYSAFNAWDMNEQWNLLEICVHYWCDFVHSQRFCHSRIIVTGKSVMVSIKNNHRLVVQSIFFKCIKELLQGLIHIVCRLHVLIYSPVPKISFWKIGITRINFKRKMVRQRDEF